MPEPVGADAVVVRTARPSDETVLFEIFRSARAVEFALLPDDPVLRATIARQQYAAQRAGYAAAHPGAERSLVMVDGEAVGSIEIDRTPPAWSVVDIAVLADHRGRGVATRLLTDLLAEASAAGRDVVLQVVPWNPAVQLYTRLGFVTVGGDETHLQMRRTAAAQGVKPA